MSSHYNPHRRIVLRRYTPPKPPRVVLPFLLVTAAGLLPLLAFFLEVSP